MRKLRIPFLVAATGGVFLCIVAANLPSAETVERPDPAVKAAGRMEKPTPRPAPETPMRRTVRQTTDEPAIDRSESLVGQDPENRGGPMKINRHPMMLRFRTALGLSKEQEQHFRNVLEERDEAVAKLQEEIIQENLFIQAEYVSKLDAIKALYYEKMSRTLDSAQHRRFTEILAEGRLGDAILFRMPPDIEVKE